MIDGAPETGRVAPWECVRLSLVVANLFWTVLCLGGYRPETLVLTVPLTLATVALHLVLPNGGGRSHPILWLSLPFLLYALANILWVTPVRWLGWRDGLTWIQPLAIAWVVLTGVRSGGGRRRLIASLAVLAIVSSGLALYQAFFNPSWLMLHRTLRAQYAGRVSGPFGAPNSLAGLMILLFPVLAALAWRRGDPLWRRLLFGLAAVLALIGAYLTISRGAWLALTASLVLWPLAFGGGSVARRLALAAAALGAGALLIALAIGLSPTVRQRFESMVRDMGERSRPILWKAVMQIHHDHPWLGSGAGSFNLEFEKYRPEGFIDIPHWAHNDYLNTLSDYGLVGCALLAIPLVASLVRLRRLRGVDAALLVGLLAFAAHLLAEFHLKMAGLGIAFGIVAGLALQVAWPAASAGDRFPALRWACALMAVGSAVWLCGPLRAETLRYHAREAIDGWGANPAGLAQRSGELDQVLADLRTAVALEPENGQVWADLAYAQTIESTFRPRDAQAWGRAAEASARQATVRNSIDPESWERLCIALDIQNRSSEAGYAMIHALALGPARPDVWYFQGLHLAHAPHSKDEALAALGVALRLDPSYTPAHSLRQQLASSPRPASP